MSVVIGSTYTYYRVNYLNYFPFKIFLYAQLFRASGNTRPLPLATTLWQAMMHSSWWKASHHKFFRKDVYMAGVPLNVAIDRSSDYQLVLLLALSGCRCAHIEEFTYWYRMRRPGSITSQGSGKQRTAVVEIKNWLATEIRKRGICEPS